VLKWLSAVTLPVTATDQDQRRGAGAHADGEEAERAGALDQRPGPHVVERHAQHRAGHDQFAAPGSRGADESPDASAAKTPSTAMPTPVVLAHRQRFDAEQGADHHGVQRQRRQRQAGTGRGGVAHREFIEDEEHAEEAEAERCDRRPVPPLRPSRFQQQRRRQHAEKPYSPSEKGKRDRIGSAGEIARDRGRSTTRRGCSRAMRSRRLSIRSSTPPLSCHAGLCHLAGQHGSATTWQVLMSPPHDFAASLRWWRRQRGLSQLETGRPRQHLAAAFEFPGTRPRTAEPGHGGKAGAGARRPAAPAQFAADRGRLCAGVAAEPTLLRPNSARFAARWISCWPGRSRFPPWLSTGTGICCRAILARCAWSNFLVGPLAPDTPVNLADALVAPDVLRPHLVNWVEVVGYFIRSVETDAAADGTAETAALLARLRTYDGVQGGAERAAGGTGDLAGAADAFPQRSIDLQLFTTIATLGIPQDITLQELRIESFFPMDETTSRTLRGWADDASSPRSVAG